MQCGHDDVDDDGDDDDDDDDDDEDGMVCNVTRKVASASVPTFLPPLLLLPPHHNLPSGPVVHNSSFLA